MAAPKVDTDDLLQQRAGRPPAKIDPEHVTKLAALGCTKAELAFFFNCSERTIDRQIRAPEEDEEPSELWQAWTFGKVGMQTSLRRQQIKAAFGNGKGAVQMLIHMSKHQLGESDRALLNLGKDGDGKLTVVIEG
jgi:hypothetical protein